MYINVCRIFSVGTEWLDMCTAPGVFAHDNAFQAWYNRIPGSLAPQATYADEYCSPCHKRTALPVKEAFTCRMCKPSYFVDFMNNCTNI